MYEVLCVLYILLFVESAMLFRTFPPDMHRQMRCVKLGRLCGGRGHGTDWAMRISSVRHCATVCVPRDISLLASRAAVKLARAPARLVAGSLGNVNDDNSNNIYDYAIHPEYVSS
jgi:hypothetical protein